MAEFCRLRLHSGFHEQSHSKLGTKLTVHLLFESLWESPPDSQERVRMGGYRATKKMPLAHNCAHAYFQDAQDPASGLDHHMPNTGEFSVVGPAFLAKLALLPLCGPFAASARVLEGRSVRCCNLERQSKGGLSKDMMLATCDGNIPCLCSMRKGDELTLGIQYITSIMINTIVSVCASFL